MGGQTIDALGISIHKFDELVQTMANKYVALFERFDSAFAAVQKKSMDDMVAFVKAHQKKYGRMMAEIFILYKTISEQGRAKVNKNALDFAALEGIDDDKKAEAQQAMNAFSSRHGQ